MLKIKKLDVDATTKSKFADLKWHLTLTLSPKKTNHMIGDTW